MRSRTLLVLTALISLTTLAGGAGARPPSGGHFPGPHGGEHHGRFLEKYAERLDLDEATRLEIEQKFEVSHQEAEPVREALHEAHRALRDTLREGEPDRAAVMAQADAIGELETELRKLRLATLLEVRGMLDEEQRAEMVAIHEERTRSRMEPMMEACAEDVDALCPDVEDPRTLIQCMRESRDELSETCRDAIGRSHRGHSRGHHGFDRSGSTPPD